MKKFPVLAATTIILFFVLSFQSCMKEIDASSQAMQDESALRKAQPVTLTAKEQLGKFIYFDPRLSSSGTQSCATCHSEKAGYAGEIQGFKSIAGIYEGAVPGRFGNRKPPTAAYASFSPILHFSVDDELIEGGSFWDGRATGWTLGSPIAEQALGPFLNPLEQNCPSSQFVLEKIATADYAFLWNMAFPDPLDWSSPAARQTSYNNVGFAVASYEASAEVNKFTSKFDYYLKGQAKLNPEEYKGMLLFNGKGKCNLCHISTSDYPGVPPLFTDFTYDNLGVPRNPDNPFYYSPYNPLGFNWVDKGLGGFLENQADPFWKDMAAENMGKHKVPTLRNVGLRVGGAQRFMHNGAFTSLKQVVDFYNTRDVKSWPAPEVPETMNTSELGDLGLTTAEVSAIVSFMYTLSDGYQPAK